MYEVQGINFVYKSYVTIYMDILARCKQLTSKWKKHFGLFFTDKESDECSGPKLFPAQQIVT